MASFVDDLGTMLQTALRAGTFTNAVSTPGGTYQFYFDYTQESGGNKISANNSCNIMFQGAEVVEQYEESARSAFFYKATFNFYDVAGKNKASAVAYQGMQNVFANHGRTVLESHLTDNGSNRLGKSGRIEWTWQVSPQDENDPYRSRAESDIRVEVWHNVPLA